MFDDSDDAPKSFKLLDWKIIEQTKFDDAESGEGIKILTSGAG